MITRAEYADIAQMVTRTTRRLSEGRPWDLFQYNGAEVQDGGVQFLSKIRYDGAFVSRCAMCGSLVGVGLTTASNAVNEPYAVCPECGPCKVTIAHEEVER